MDFSRYPALLNCIEPLWAYPVTAEIVLARNVISVDKIEDYVKELKTGVPQIDKWLGSNLRNYLIRDHDEVKPVQPGQVGPEPEWLKKAFEKGEPVYEVFMLRPFKDKIDHVIDYLKSDEAPKRLDALTVPEAMKQADAWTKMLTKKKVNPLDAAEGEEIIKKYSDGFTWRKLTNEAALSREGTEMGHCVGSYWREVESGKTQIYSLRDNKNQPHVTIEVSDDSLVQIKGKGNAAVASQYRAHAQNFVRELGDGEITPVRVDIQECRDVGNIGMFRIKAPKKPDTRFMHQEMQLVTLEEVKENPEQMKELMGELGFFNHMLFKEHPSEVQIAVVGDGIAAGSKYLDVIIDMVKFAIGKKAAEEFKGLMEDFYDVDFRLEDSDVEELYDSIEKAHPKTYEKLLLEIEAAADDENDDDYYSGRFLNAHSDKLEAIYDSVISALSDGWKRGTELNAHNYVKNKLDDLEWSSGSKTYKDPDGTVWFVISPEAIAEDDLGELENDINRGRDGFDYEYDSEAAKELFYEMLSERDYTVD